MGNFKPVNYDQYDEMDEIYMEMKNIHEGDCQRRRTLQLSRQ